MYGEWIIVKESTEEEEGLKERTCECGEKETEVINKLEHVHKYSEWIIVKEKTNGISDILKLPDSNNLTILINNYEDVNCLYQEIRKYIYN